jgi:hypothetical protein
MTSDVNRDRRDNAEIVQAEKAALPDCVKKALGLPSGGNPISSGQYSRLRPEPSGPPSPMKDTRMISNKGRWTGGAGKRR